MLNHARRTGNLSLRLLVGALFCVSSLASAAPTVNADPAPNLWVDSDRNCFSAFGKGMIFMTSMAPNVEEENFWENPI